MLVTYLAVMLSLLALLGVTLGAMFRNQYVYEKETELRREAEAINTIIVDKYLDDDKRPVARDELFTIARRYDALVQIQFLDLKYGRVEFVNEDSAQKWGAYSAMSIAEQTDEVLKGNAGFTFSTNMLEDIVSIRS